MKKPKPKGTKKRSKKKATHSETQCASWVDEHLDWISDGSSGANSKDSFSIVSWNVLADSYCSYRSHQHLPMKYQRHVFDRPQRQHHVRQILRRFATALKVDILVLQEVDAPLEVPKHMTELGYSGVQTPTCPAGKDGRVDACACYYRTDDWTCLQHKILRLDDLSTLCSKSDKTGLSSMMSSTSNLQGVQSTFVRKNVALLIKLENKQNYRKIVVAVAHLFWNPNYDYVKLCQAHYVALQAKEFSEGLPIIFCGDFNSQPAGHVHQYLVKGFVNARLAAPWYRYSYTKQAEGGDETACSSEDIASSLTQVSISEVASLSTPAHTNPKVQVRYMLDYTLNRFCRWLRILGLDAALESEEEERLRTKEGKLTIFSQCRREQRTLVTTSSRLLLRKDCPPGAYCLDTKSLSNLELSLCHLLLSHGVKLEPTNFLSRCVVCNGKINQVFDEKKIEKIFASHQAPKNLNQEVMEVFQCKSCNQGYWWCDRPTSAASRVKNQATKLLEICIRAGVPVATEMGMFSYIDLEGVKRQCPDDTEERALLDQRLDVLEWLQQEKLENPFGPLRNVYATEDGEETLPFTNVTSDFVGHLDYVMHEEDRIQVEEKLYVPKSFPVLNGEGLRNGHLLPSNVWPSDHLAIGGRLAFLDMPQAESQSGSRPGKNEEATPPQVVPLCAPTQNGPPIGLPTFSLPDSSMHGQRCACGCVPNVLSLFEMAELRKQARLKKDHSM